MTADADNNTQPQIPQRMKITITKAEKGGEQEKNAMPNGHAEMGSRFGGPLRSGKSRRRILPWCLRMSGTTTKEQEPKSAMKTGYGALLLASISRRIAKRPAAAVDGS